jgi:hypothetical protein
MSNNRLRMNLQRCQNATRRNSQSLRLSSTPQKLKETGFKVDGDPQQGGSASCGFAVNFLVSPLLAGFGVDIPQADTSVMMPVLMGLLGLGGMRSFERFKGVEK